MSQYQETSFRSLFCRLSVFCMQSRAKSSFVKPRGYTGFSAYSSATQCFPPNIKSDQREMKSCCFFFSFFKARHIQRLKIFAVKVCSFPPLESYRSGIYVLHSSWRSPSITKSFLLLFFFLPSRNSRNCTFKIFGIFSDGPLFWSWGFNRTIVAESREVFLWCVCIYVFWKIWFYKRRLKRLRLFKLRINGQRYIMKSSDSNMNRSQLTVMWFKKKH